MTVRRKPHTEQVERLLAQAHRTRQEVAVGENWAHGIMRVVRQDAVAHPYSSMLAWAEPLVWRAAAGAALVAVVFAGSVVAYTSRQPEPVTAIWLEEFDAGPPLIAE
ncbi:MAG: hypothetical protein HY348_04000 [Nitrospira defluvii]|nr:hypothetical protein [Nitrospira defluvii]